MPQKTSSRKKRPDKAVPKAKTRASVKEKGADLFEKVVAMTGIPAESLGRELKAILDRKGLDVDHLTLDQLRVVVASYLREIMGGILDRPAPRKPDLPH